MADLDVLLKFVEIISIVGGGITVVWRVSSLATKLEILAQQQASEINALKIQVDKLSGVLITLAQQSGRMDRMADTISSTGHRVDTLEERVSKYLDQSNH